ncbi:MAG: LemA family protein [Elusimicrobiaceae bacterium]|nr:LemA family protein [Elusimicrobiaceae bacterium]
MLAWFIFGFMCALVILCILAYFKFMSLHKAVKRAWLRLDVSLKNRRDMLPNLSLIAAAFDQEDRSFSAELNMLKEKVFLCNNIDSRISCEEEISKHLRQLFTLACKSPDFAKDEHFQHIRKKLSSLEGRVQSCKKRYNSAVRDFNTLADIFPLSIIAKILEFGKFTYFDFENSL